MKTFDQILNELLAGLRDSPASGFVAPEPAPASSAPASTVRLGAPLPPAFELPTPITPSWSSIGSASPAPPKLMASTPISTLPTRSLPADSAIPRVPPVSSPDYSQLYSAPRCQWGGPGAYVPTVPLLTEPSPVSTPTPAPAPTPPPLPSPAPKPRPVPPTPPSRRITGDAVGADHRVADCRTLLDRPEDDEFGTRVFRVFD
jgi:hypothetical protein